MRERERKCNANIFVIHLILVLFNFSEVISQLLYYDQFHKLTMHLLKYKYFFILNKLPFNIL